MSPAGGSQDRVRVAAAVVWRDDRLLMTRRPPGGPLGLKWECPGGKIEPGETPEHALAREIFEELGVSAKVGRTLQVHAHSYAHGLDVEITFIECALGSLEFRPSEAAHEVRWMRPDEIMLEDVLEADRDFLRALGVPARPGAPREF